MSKKLCLLAAAACLLAILLVPHLPAQDNGNQSLNGNESIRHVLLISIDGMHALDFINCSNGIGGANGGAPYCPNLAALKPTGVSYLYAYTSEPSHSFPGLMALMTGGSPRSVGGPCGGGYTAWIDKHPSYSFVAGPGGTGLNDYYAPEVDSAVVPLPGIKTPEGASCGTILDSTADLTSWTNSFLNIQCYDALKVKALLNEIAGKTHAGAPAQIPAVFGMNFQAVYFGESLNEPTVGPGGYQNAEALPSAQLLNEIEFVDSSIGEIVNALKAAGIYDNTLLIITAKHGDSPIDPTRYVADGANTPATLLGSAIPYSESPLNPTGIGATEDDVSVLWLKAGARVPDAVQLLEADAAEIGLGEVFYGPTLALNYDVGGLGSGQDPRSPDIIVTPNIGVTYSASTTMIGDHGGFGHDDTNVMLLVANPGFAAQTVAATTRTAQVAPTILDALGLDPESLDAVKAEGTTVLPEVGAQLANMSR